MNKLPDIKEFWLTDNHNLDFMQEYYSLAKRVYNIAYDEEELMYQGIHLNNAMNNDDSLSKSEIRYTLYTVIKWIGWFRDKIGNNIYDDNTSDKILDRLKRCFYPELDY